MLIWKLIPGPGIFADDIVMERWAIPTELISEVVGIICAHLESQSTMTRRALFLWLMDNSMIRSTDMTCHLLSGMRLGRSLPIGEAGVMI